MENSVRSHRSNPVVTFYRLVEEARLPQRADRSAAGTLPTRAYRYCHAVTTAAGFGWYIFPPMDFSLIWDGEEVFWTYEGADGWLPLSSAQFPYFSAKFNAVAPESTYDCSPPFLTALAEPGAVQIWSGLIARTAPDWSLLIRPPANLPGGAGYALYEGIVEADNWFGPLFTNVRLTRTNQPVRFKADYPLVQAQPLPRALYSEEMLGAMEIVPGLAGLSEREWDDYFTAVVAPNADPNRPHGRYAVAARKRRPASCPFAVKSLSTSSEGFAGRA